MTRFATAEGGPFSGCGGEAPDDRGQAADDGRLFADRQHHFKVRFFCFAGGNFGGSDVQAASHQQAADGAWGEPGMPLAVASSHLVLLMLIETEQDQTPAWAQDP